MKRRSLRRLGCRSTNPHSVTPLFIGSTIADVQRCLRLNDLAAIDDDHHHLVFHMMGLFTFRDWTVPQAIAFWHGYLRSIGVVLTHVTVHPDCVDEWSAWHQPYGLPVLTDTDCLWTDGGMGGHSTEFYVGHVEVGNIVNTLGTCIDVGFGLERLEQVTGRPRNLSGTERLRYTLDVLEGSGVAPGPKGARICDAPAASHVARAWRHLGAPLVRS